ncbi:MAG TPA: hypothetical protein VGW31_05330 [Hanamia sp.]|nr:hypothetical protein [Hanamia sp.]
MKKLLKIIWTPEIEDMIEGEILKTADVGNYASKQESKKHSPEIFIE